MKDHPELRIKSQNLRIADTAPVLPLRGDCGGQGYRDKPVAGKRGIGLKGPLAEKGFDTQTDFKALGS